MCFKELFFGFVCFMVGKWGGTVMIQFEELISFQMPWLNHHIVISNALGDFPNL